MASRCQVSLLTGLITLFSTTAQSQVSPSAYVNFEGAQTNPIRMSADGTRLYAVNTADARLSVFDLTQPSSPKLIAEIPVGIEPVSVNPRTNDEVWVVNQESDSVSIVSVSKGIVTDTIYAKDEPADLVFAGSNKAFVSVARSNHIAVFDTTTHALVKSIPVFGSNPRAMAVSLDGTQVYAAFALSGNRTTIIPEIFAPPQPPPTNPALPPAPRVSLIVDATDPNWASLIRYTMPDNDVVVIDDTTLSVVGYFSRVGTINLGLAVRPLSGEIFVANTDARNLVRYEPNVRGHWVDNRISRISKTGTITTYDLNPTIDYTTLPNPAAQAIALAQPTAIAFHPTGAFLYVAAFGTDRVGVVDINGNVLARIGLEPTASGANVDPRNKRGPRGLALNNAAHRLYVQNRISNTISIIDTTSNAVLSEIAVGSFDPTPTIIRNGRGFLYDAKLSGNGTGACASCHVDAETDLLAWDLGDPGGNMQSVVQTGNTIQFHPMKGPMTTQTLRGLNGLQPYHWRGDKADFTAFNPAFNALMGSTPLVDADIAAYTSFINTIQFQPNPNRNLDNTLPASFNGGDPNAGRNSFLNTPFVTGFTCNLCHASNPGPGTTKKIQDFTTQTQPMKIPHLRNVYQKRTFSNVANTQSMSGFGIENAGEFSGVFELLGEPEFHTFTGDTTTKLNIAAFVSCFDTGTPPVVGYSRTVTAANGSSAAVQQDVSLLVSQAVAGNIDLIAKGTINGQVHGLLYQPATGNFISDQTGLGPFTTAQLAAKIASGDTLTLMGVPRGSGVRMGIDRDLNGVLDGDQH